MPDRSNFRRFSTMATLCLITLLQGCGQEIDARQTQDVNGLLYKLNDSDPFTGKVTNYPLPGFLSSLGSCTLQVKKGQLDGTFTCTSTAGVKLAEIEYKDGVKNGVEKTWDSASGNPKTKIEWKNGKHDGLEELYNLETGKVVSQTHWSNNQKVGDETKWDPSGQTVLVSLSWKDGKATGFSKVDGGEENIKDSLRDGVFREKSYLGGIIESNYKTGLCYGPRKTWDDKKNLRKEEEICPPNVLSPLDGWVREWDENGTLRKEEHYTASNWDTAGETGNSMKGYGGDTFREYNKEGKLIYEVLYRDGQHVETIHTPTPTDSQQVSSKTKTDMDAVVK